jgi:two-component system sensor histidine kinase YesM
MSEGRLARAAGEGIGMSNVRARLKLLYGEEFRFQITSRPGMGTQVRIEVPELVSLSPVAT